MTYINGYLLAVPTAKREAYLAVAKKINPVFKRYGATRVVEGWGVDVPDGKVTSFPMATKAKDDETVLFSWMEWPSKAVADAGVKSAMNDPELADGPAEMPFDGMRMMWGGFDVIYDE